MVIFLPIFAFFSFDYFIHGSHYKTFDMGGRAEQAYPFYELGNISVHKKNQLNGERLFQFQQQFSDPINAEDWAIYVPHTHGKIEFFINDVLIYSKVSQRNILNPMMLELGSYWPADLGAIEKIVFISTRPSTDLDSAVINPKSIILGPTESVIAQYKKDQFFNVTIRYILFGIQFGLILLIATAQFNGIFRRLFTAPILLTFYLMLLNIFSLFPHLTGARSYLLIFIPIFLLLIYRTIKKFEKVDLFFTSDAESEEKFFSINLKTKIGVLEFLFILCPVFSLLLSTTGITLNSINQYLNQPLILIGTSLLFINVIKVSFNSPWTVAAKTSLCVGFFLLTLIHDLVGGLGLIDIASPITHLGSLIFAIFCAQIFAVEILNFLTDTKAKFQNQIEVSQKHQRQLSIVNLREQEAQKDLEFKQEINRLNSDLHDGVLTNLSMMKRKLQDKNQDDFPGVLGLLTNTMSEIRFIIGNQTRKFETLSELYVQVFDLIISQLLKPDVEYEIDQGQAAEIEFFNPKQSHVIFRLFQELIHNAMIRADAKFIKIQTKLIATENRNFCVIEISNAGGLSFADRQADKKGYGLRNIQDRCDAYDIKFSILSVETGATAKLEFEVNITENV